MKGVVAHDPRLGRYRKISHFGASIEAPVFGLSASDGSMPSITRDAPSATFRRRHRWTVTGYYTSWYSGYRFLEDISHPLATITHAIVEQTMNIAGMKKHFKDVDVIRRNDQRPRSCGTLPAMMHALCPDVHIRARRSTKPAEARSDDRQASGRKRDDVGDAPVRPVELWLGATQL